jgi:hypothetical protein
MHSAVKNVVETKLLYLSNRGTIATYMASEAGGDIPDHLGDYIHRTVSIQDARLIADKLSLDHHGFRLINQLSNVSDYYSDDQIYNTYESEVKQSILDSLAGESIRHIQIFDHTRRTSSNELRKALKVREPASIIHNDYTDDSAVRTREDFFKKDPEANEQLHGKRFMIINLWRSIGGTVKQAPMTLCSANTISAEDVVSVERVAKNHRGELQLAVWNPDHQWFYFPDMTMQEALIFKTFDSALDGRARYTIHTAFDDPNSPVNAPPRESIETRCLVFLE